MLLVPFLAEGIANAWFVDADIAFLSFGGAILAIIGTFKITKGDRIRREKLI
jgi:hypothetical protein